MDNIKKNKILILISIFILSITLFLLANASIFFEKTSYYEKQVEAANKLQICFDYIKAYKEAKGIPLSDKDYFQTGMLGTYSSEITTTLGPAEVKRTTAQPDMAALCVRMLYKAGIKEGDTIGIGCSGSFPSMNLAMICACETLNIKAICISSVGSSTYGANNIELTFPEMLDLLNKDGILHTNSSAVSLGGDKDCAKELDKDVINDIKNRFFENNFPLFEIDDYQKNLLYRRSIYEKYGPINCFVGIGGNISSSGLDEEALSLGQGVLSFSKPYVLNSKSGLVQYYLYNGIPVINILNIKKIMADYGMAFDPDKIPIIGTSPIYYNISFNKYIIFLNLILITSTLIYIKKHLKKG